MNKSKKILLIGILIIGILSFFKYKHFTSPGQVTVVSVSTDGHYAISTSLNKKAILWDLQSKSYQMLDKNANIYSAYFIKNTDKYMWQQNINNQVYIKNIAGNLVKQFNPGFPSYGQVMTSDLTQYFASNIEWDIYERQDDKKQLVEKRFSDASFLGAEKLVNLQIKNNLLLAAGLGGDGVGVSIWNIKTKQKIFTLDKSKMKTFATLSPDGKYIISGDENTLGYVWNIDGKLKFQLDDLYFGKLIKIGKNTDNWKWDATGLIKKPKDYETYLESESDAILSLKFIDLKGDYLRFTTYVPYAILYNIHDPKPKKYFYLGRYPFPCISDYSRDECIDTSPKAHLLVMGKDTGSGIMVYRFDPQKETLKKIWVF